LDLTDTDNLLVGVVITKSKVRVVEDGTLHTSKSDPLCKEWVLETSGSSLAAVSINWLE
jgi:hypothetical protein